MILVRDVFRLKFGKAKDVKAAMKEAKGMMGEDGKNRILFDLVGPSYTMVMESTCKDLAEFESMRSKDMGKDWQDWYQHKFVPHVDSSYREIFTVLD
jgi:hypothetical protein